VVVAVEQDEPAPGETATPGYAVLNVRAGWHIGYTEITVGVGTPLHKAYRRHLDPQAILRPERNVCVRLGQAF
jgi:hypothetical protein